MHENACDEIWNVCKQRKINVIFTYVQRILSINPNPVDIYAKSVQKYHLHLGYMKW